MIDDPQFGAMNKRIMGDILKREAEDAAKQREFVAGYHAASEEQKAKLRDDHRISEIPTTGDKPILVFW